MNTIDRLLTVLILFAGTIGIIYIAGNDSVGEFLSENNTSEADDIEGQKKEVIRIINGYKALELENDVLESAGLSSEMLTTMSISPEYMAYAEVMDIKPLVDARYRYSDLLSEKRIYQAGIANLKKNLKMSEALHEIKSLSTRELDKERAALDQKVAELVAVQTRIENYIIALKSDWGETLGNLILDPEMEPDFNDLAMHRESLVILSLPRSRSHSDTIHEVFINYTNHRNSAIQAFYVDGSKQGGNPLYGESFIYRVESGKLRPGMRLFAWVSESMEDLTGIFIPEEAVVWYANEPWIYIQYDKNIFLRKPLAGARKVENGWLMIDAPILEHPVITAGGQTLLSEEFKWAIPDEDDD